MSIGSFFATASLIGATLPREMSSAVDKFASPSLSLASIKSFTFSRMSMITMFPNNEAMNILARKL